MLKRIWVGVLALIGSVGGAEEFKVGDKVEVEWRSVWYPAEVKAVEGPNRWKIGYDGHGANWDEVVGPERIRVRGGAAKPQPSPAPPPTATTAGGFKVGDKVEVEWRSKWYAAEVKAVEGPDRWKIGYDGYGANWDEVVGPERIRVRGAATQAQAGAATQSGPAATATTGSAAAPTNPSAANTTASVAAAPVPQETFPWPERPAGAKAGLEGAFLRVQTWFFNGRASTENQGWFFTKDGRVAMTPKGGFEAQALADAPRARKSDGVYWIENDKLFVRWANKEKTEEHKFARKGKDLEIGGFFASYAPGFKKGWRTDASFEGGATASGAGAFAASSNTLTLRRDGTFGRRALGSASVTTSEGTRGGSSSSASDGSYEFDGYTLTLSHADGRVERFTVFGAFGRDAQGAPEYLWREGLMMQRLDAK